MPNRYWIAWLLLGLLVVSAAGAAEDAELFVSTPLVADGLLLVASSDWSGRYGHLRALDLENPAAGPLWDAAERMPLAGTGSSPGELPGSDPPARPDPLNSHRILYTNLPGPVGSQSLVPLSPLAAAALAPALEAATPEAATVLINQLRGRTGATLERPTGTGERPRRLWGLAGSAPLLIGRSPFFGADAERERVVYAGGADGLLHAFFAGAWEEHAQRYPKDGPLLGRELWGYLPASLLPAMADQPFDAPIAPPAAVLDGTLASGDFFIDLDGDGRRRWHTLLAGSGTLVGARRSGLFLLDVSDPRQSYLLWEQPLPGGGAIRGVRFGPAPGGSGDQPGLYLTAGRSDGAGMDVLAIDGLSGQVNWRFGQDDPLPVGASLPAVPALMDLDGDGVDDLLICGDLAGRLWALQLATGAALGGAPVYTVPGGAAEPIGAPVTVRGTTVYFGTGGAAHADPAAGYAVYALTIDAAGGRLQWRLPLQAGEQVWQAPAVDRFGHLLLGLARGYQPSAGPAPTAGSGRLVLLDGEGETLLEERRDAPLVAPTRVGEDLVISLSLTGEVRRFGEGAGFNAAAALPRALRLLSWRQR